MKSIEVVAAIIREGNSIFATQRGYGDFEGGWEFPGGKVEPGETHQEALVREIREELQAEIDIEDFFMTVEHDYDSFHLTMHCYLCSPKSKGFHLVEHKDAEWLTIDFLDSVSWLPADLPIVESIKKQGIV